MDDISLLIEVDAFVARDCNGFPRAVVLVEELDRVASRDDPRSLVLEQELRRALEDGGVVAVGFEGDAREESA